MKSALFPARRRRGALLALAAALALAGCGVLVTGTAWVDSDEVKPDSDRVVVVDEVKRLPVAEHANRFAMMAIFAKAVYRKDLPTAERKARGCAYLKTGEDVTLGMPRLPDGSGWYRWRGTGAAIACDDVDGLAYETYVHVRPGPEPFDTRIDEAVLAFRGTENDTWFEFLHDWSSNFAAFFGLEPREYLLAQERTRNIVAALTVKNKQLPIYATGHSLGGGLAQQAGYLSAGVTAVYAFDPTPVTNWGQLKLKKAIEQEDPKIYRVYHWHEGLAYLRNVTSRFNTRRFGRSDYEFFFQKVDPVAMHEMGILACHLARRVTGNMAEHHLPADFARQVLAADYHRRAEDKSAEHPICPAGVHL